MPSTPMVPAVLYAAKSTQDKHLSIPTQLQNCREKVEEEGWLVVGEYHDENFSAYSGNRGPDLKKAEAHADRAADEYGCTAMLVVQHSDRLARGAGDAPGASDSLIEVWHRLRRKDVHVRSFQNDTMMSKPVLVAVAAEQAYEESERKSKAIKDGKRRRAEDRGESNGPLNFGYRFHDPEAKHKRRVFDEGECEGWKKARALLLEGKTLGFIARWLNGHGYESKRGNAFSSQRVKDMLANPYYAGKIKRADGTLIEGQHPALISWDEHDAILKALASLSHQPTTKGGRRPDQVNLLSGGLMRCAHCGRGIWQRKHESGRRDYICGNVRQKTGTCDACSFDAPTAERAVMEHLGSLFVDLGAWIEKLNAERSDQREVLEREASDLMKERAALEGDEDLVRADYMRQLRGGNERAADLAAAELERIEGERVKLDSRLEDLQAQLSEWEGSDSSDEVLDWWTEFSTAIRENVLEADSVAQANEGLKEKLAAIFVRSEGEVPRLDFILKERPPGAPLVAASLWVDEDPPDDWPTFVDYAQEAGEAGLVIPNGSLSSGCSR